MTQCEIQLYLKKCAFAAIEPLLKQVQFTSQINNTWKTKQSRQNKSNIKCKSSINTKAVVNTLIKSLIWCKYFSNKILTGTCESQISLRFSSNNNMTYSSPLSCEKFVKRLLESNDMLCGKGGKNISNGLNMLF